MPHHLHRLLLLGLTACTCPVQDTCDVNASFRVGDVGSTNVDSWRVELEREDGSVHTCLIEQSNRDRNQLWCLVATEDSIQRASGGLLWIARVEPPEGGGPEEVTVTWYADQTVVSEQTGTLDWQTPPNLPGTCDGLCLRADFVED